MSGIWEEVENSDAGDADSGQSFCGKLRRAGRTEPGREEVRESTLGLGDYMRAIPDLDRVACADVKFDYYRAAGLLGDAYARTGELEKAAQWFAPATQYSTTPETLYNYAWFLKAQGRTDEAREW